MLSKKEEVIKNQSDTASNDNTNKKQSQNSVNNRINDILLLVGLINTVFWFLSSLGANPILPVSYETSCKITEFMSEYLGWYFTYNVGSTISVLAIICMVYRLVRKDIRLRTFIFGFIVNSFWLLSYIALRLGWFHKHTKKPSDCSDGLITN